MGIHHRGIEHLSTHNFCYFTLKTIYSKFSITMGNNELGKANFFKPQFGQLKPCELCTVYISCLLNYVRRLFQLQY